MVSSNSLSISFSIKLRRYSKIDQKVSDFVSNYTNMLDILGRHSIPATIFQCGGMQSSKPLLWEHQLYWLGCDPILSSEFFSYLDRFFPEWPKSFNEIQETMHPKKIESIIAQFMESYPHELKDMHSQARLIYPDETLIKTASSSGVGVVGRQRARTSKAKELDDATRALFKR